MLEAKVAGNIFYSKNKWGYFNVKDIVKHGNGNSLFHLYVHDSGLFGMLLCCWWSMHKKIISITFDYHDWIPWEISYQLSRRIKSPQIVRIFSKYIYSFSKFFFSAVRINNVIGISENQVKEFKKDYKLTNARQLVIPNTRKKIHLKKAVYNNNFDGVLWIGNVMKGRDLDILSSYIVKYNERNHTQFNLYIIGNIFDEDYFHSLKSQKHIIYLNSFKSDSDILEKIQRINVAGFFYGWDDIYDTGINSIASPNKAYSYVNIGIPTIMGDHMSSLKSSFENSVNSIFWIDCYLDFEKSIDYIKINYKVIIESYDISTIWEDELEQEIESFFMLK